MITPSGTSSRSTGTSLSGFNCYHRANGPTIPTPAGNTRVSDILTATIIRPTRCNYLQHNCLSQIILI
jgi:hypothetical protein